MKKLLLVAILTAVFAIVATHGAITQVNILSFGADPTGTRDSTAAIQQAFDSLPITHTPLVQGAHSGEVVAPPGTYLISSPISIPCGAIFKGFGRDATTISNTTTTATSLQIRVQSNANTQTIVVRDMTIAGSQAATAGVAIDCTTRGAPIIVNGVWPILENLTLFGHYDGIRMDTAVLGSVRDVRIHNPQRYGVYSTGRMNEVQFAVVWVIEAGSDGWRIESASACDFAGVASQSCGGWGFYLGTAAPFFSKSRFVGGAEDNASGGFHLTEPFSSFIQASTYDNHGSGLVMEGGNGVTLIPDLQADDGAITMSLLTGPTYGPIKGLTVLGEVLAGDGATPIDNPSAITFWNRREDGTGRSDVIIGYKTFIDPNTGSIVTGRTNTIGLPSFVARHNNARLQLESDTDPANYFTRLVNNYNFALAMQLFGGGGGTNGVELMNWSPATNKVTMLPLDSGGVLAINPGAITAGATTSTPGNGFVLSQHGYRVDTDPVAGVARFEALGTNNIVWRINNTDVASIDKNGNFTVTGEIAALLLSLNALNTSTLTVSNTVNFLSTNAVPANTNAAKWVKIKIEGVDYAIPASILP